MRVLPLFLAAVLVCAVVCGATVGRDGDDPDPNPSGPCGDELTWELAGNDLTISGSGDMFDFDQSGTNIAPWKADAQYVVKTVTIGESVTSIGNNAFYGCSDLESVDIQGTLTRIGEMAFKDCNSLNSFSSIPVSNVAINANAFNFESQSLEELTISGSVAAIGDNVFGGSLTSIKIEGSVAENGFADSAFADCTSLEKFTVTGSVGELPGQLFTGLYELQELSFGSASFYFNLFCTYTSSSCPYSKQATICDCYKIESIKLTDPNGVSSINNNVFSGMDSLKYFNVAGSISMIGNDAFASSGLVEFEVDGDVDAITSDMFSGCSYLENVTFAGSVGYIPSGTFHLSSLKHLVFGSVEEFGSQLFCSGSSASYCYFSVKSITVNGDVGTIDPFAFCNPSTSYTSYVFSSLTSFTVSGLIGSIGRYAFNDCAGLTTLSLNVNNSISDYAFQGCISLTELSLDAINLTLGDYVFSGCTDLETLTISGYVKEIPDSSFYIGSGQQLSTLVFGSVGTFGERLFCDSTYSYYPKCYNSVTSVTINGDVGVISGFGNPNAEDAPSYYFDPSYYNWNLNSFTVHGTVGVIQPRAFEGCVSLTELYFNGYDGDIGDYAFYSCWSLTKVNVSGNVEAIGNYSFYGCSLLSEVNFEGPVMAIGHYAFYGCSSLRSFPFTDSINTIGKRAFYNCSSFTKLFLPDLSLKMGDKTIEGDVGEGAFYMCDNINLAFYHGTRDPCRKHYSESYDDYTVFDRNVAFERVLVNEGYKDKKFCGAFVKKIATGSAAGLKSHVSLLVGIVLMTVLLAQW